jgi:hypothetical protein
MQHHVPSRSPWSYILFVQWDDATLVQVLTSTKGNAEAAIDVILAVGTPTQFKVQQLVRISFSNTFFF